MDKIKNVSNAELSKRISAKDRRACFITDKRSVEEFIAIRTAPSQAVSRHLIKFRFIYNPSTGLFLKHIISNITLKKQYSEYAKEHYKQYWFQEQEGIKHFYGIIAYKDVLKLAPGCKPLEPIEPNIKNMLAAIALPWQRRCAGISRRVIDELSKERTAKDEHEIIEIAEEPEEVTPRDEIDDTKGLPEDYVDDCLGEVWFAYLTLKDRLSGRQLAERITKHLNDWWYNRCIQASDRELSVNWLPTARYKVYRRPYTNDLKTCNYRVGYSVCDPLAQDIQGKPEYYMVGDICWGCYLSKGLDPIRVMLAWLPVFDAAVSGGLITCKEGIAYYLSITDYYSRYQDQIAHKLGVTKQAIQQRIIAGRKKFEEKSPKNLVSLTYINRGARAIRQYEAAHQQHRRPRYRIPTEQLIKEAIIDKNALARLEQQCRPEEFVQKGGAVTNQQDVECFERTEALAGNAFQEGKPLFSMAGASGLGMRMGGYLKVIRACPACNTLVKGTKSRCPDCKVRLRVCKNLACGNTRIGKQLLLYDGKCPRCSSLQPYKFCQSTNY